MVEQKALMVRDKFLFSAVIKFFYRKEGRSWSEFWLRQKSSLQHTVNLQKTTVVLFVCVFVCGCEWGSGNKFAKSETDKNASFTCWWSSKDSIQRWEAGGGWGCEINSSGNTRDGSPNIWRSHLQSAFSLLPSFQKHLDVQASRPEEEWRHSGMDFWRLILAHI